MKLKLTTKIKRNKAVMFKEVEGVVYILDPRNATIHTLNKTASFIWNQLKTPCSIENIVSSVCNQFEVKKNKAQRDIMKLISKYLKEEFLKKYQL